MNSRSIKVSAVVSLIAGIFWGLLAAPSVRAQTLEEARTLEATGDYGGAFLTYREVFEQSPALAPAALGMLRNGIRLERWDAARRALDRYEQLQPGTDTAAVLGARLYYQQDQFDTALEWAQRARERRTGSWKPYYLTARIQFLRGSYVDARDQLQSAELRAETNQWIELLQLLNTYQLEGIYEDQALQRLRSIADHPQVFWELSAFEGIEWSREQAAGLLREGVGQFPAPPPPLTESVTESEYRFRLAVLERRLGNTEESRRVLSPVESDDPSIRWLKAVNEPDTVARFDAQSSVLTDAPDRLIFRWSHSRLARELEGLNGPNRNETSDFFYEEYRNNRLFGYPESALGSLIRSLELQPTHAERQFQLAEYYHTRGWKQSELEVLRRVRELGLDAPSRVTDYREGLSVDTDPERPEIPSGRVLLDVSLNTLWEGPVEGREVLQTMINHSLFHQPAFDPVRGSRSSESDSPVRVRMSQHNADAAVQLAISRWEEVMEATLTYYLPGNRVREVDFYARGRMKPWRLLQTVVEGLKREWPWEGRLYREEPDGAWVNLGLVHGVTDGDTLQVDGRRLGTSEVLENRLKLDYPTPVLQGRLDRGMTVETLSDTEPNE
jgi:tetratricopeptide (TPR) repeat protein